MKHTCCRSVGRITTQTLKTLDPVLSKWYKVGYSATLARAHVHRFICSVNGVSSFAGGPMQRVHCKGHRYYLNVLK